jgi:hypothetical protein
MQLENGKLLKFLEGLPDTTDQITQIANKQATYESDLASIRNEYSNKITELNNNWQMTFSSILKDKDNITQQYNELKHNSIKMTTLIVFIFLIILSGGSLFLYFYTKDGMIF